MKLYHFTTLESFTKIWVTKTLKFSVYKNLNDSFEVNKYIDALYPHYESFDNFYTILSKYKQISFAMDSDEEGYKSPMMWGHYAHNENGVCIELDSEKLKLEEEIILGKVEYDYKVPFIPFDKSNIYLVVLPKPPFLTPSASSSSILPYGKKIPWTKPVPFCTVISLPSLESFVILQKICPSLSEK